MDTLRKLTGYSSPGAQQAAAEAAVADDLDGDVLLEEAGNDGAGLAGALSIRAPISADDADLGDGDGEASFGSGDSFNSALERMAASSTVSLEAGSPIGSLQDGGSPLHEHFGHHRQQHNHEHHPLHHGGSEGAVVVGNGNGAGEESPVMPVAKLTADDELLEDDEARDDSAEDTVEENGDDGLEYEEAEGGEDVLPSEDEEEVYPRVTAEGLPVRGVEGDYLNAVVETELPQVQSNLSSPALLEEKVAEPQVTDPGEAEDISSQNGLLAGETVDAGPTSEDVLEELLSKPVEAGAERDTGSPLQSDEPELIAVLGRDDEESGDRDAAEGLRVSVVEDGHLDAVVETELPQAQSKSSSPALLEEKVADPQVTEPGATEDIATQNALLAGETVDAGPISEDVPEKILPKAVEAGAERGAGSPLESDEPELIAVLGKGEETGDRDAADGLPVRVVEDDHLDAVVETELPQAQSNSSGPAVSEEKVAEPQVTEPGATEGFASENGLLAAETVDAGPTSEDVPEVLPNPVEAAAERDAGSPLQSDESELIAVLGRDDEETGDNLNTVVEMELPQAQSSSSPALLEEKVAEPQVSDPGATEDIASQNGLLAGETVDAGPTSEDVLDEILSKPVEAGVERDAGSPLQSDESELIAVLGRDDEETGDWDEDIEEEDEEDDEILIERSAALAALVHAADSSSKGNGDAPSLGAAGPSLPARPAGLGRSVPSLEPAPRTASSQRGGGATASTQPAGPTEEAQPNVEANDGHEETREKLQLIRVKFLRLAHRLGQSAHNVVVAQVLYRLGLAEQLRGGRSSGRSGAFSFDRASAIAEEQEAAGPGELDFTCTIMLLGKTGVGKSATINSIFDEVKTVTNAFSPATRKVQEIIGTVHGIKVRVIDTPGLLPSVSDQRQNEKVMSSVKRFIKKSPPDIVLYFDRLDMQSRDYGDLPLLRTITDTFGPAVWFNAIVVLTHAASAPPDGPNGLPLSYEMFVAQRSHVVQQTIRHAAGDMRLMNPVSLVENHPACRTNRAGQRVLPNGQIWKPQLLLLCFASKILAEANSLLKLQDNAPGRPFGSRQRVPPLPFLLSSLLQSRQQLKMMDDQGGDEDESEDELDEDDNSDDETEFDQLPPFRRLTKEEVLELDDQQRKDYFQELADRERLFQKKQWREELRRRKELKKRMAAAKEQLAEEAAEDESARSAAVPVPLPDMVLPPSFDSDSPTHRYRYLEAPNQWLVRPVLETHGWDHDSGYDGFSVEKSFAVNSKFPAQVSGQLTKDKKETNLTLECAASFKHGEGKVTLSGLDIQTIGKDLSYTLRSETRFSNFKQNKTTGGLALTLLGDTIAAGLKLENRLLVGKRLKLVVNGGALTGKGDVAYGGSLEATLRDKDYPFSRTLSTLGLSIMDWHGDLAIGGNLQSQFLLGKTMISARANLNNRGAGQISIRSSSSEQLQMALIGIIPILRAVFSSKLFGSSQPGQ